MRQPRKDIDNCIEEVLFREKTDQSWSRLKNMVEKELDFKKEGRKLYDEIFNSSLKRLESNKGIDRHLCASRNEGRICYSLTNLRRQEMEMKLKENLATYSLIFFTELYNASPQYALNDEAIKYFLENENIDLSLGKLIEIGKMGITTVYRPIQYVQVVKEERTILESQKQNKKEPKLTKEDHYYYRIIGISAQEIFESIKAIKDQIDNSGFQKEGKKTRLIDKIHSIKIDKKRYQWFLVDDKINQETINEAISNLKKLKMIQMLGIHSCEPRYTLQDDLYELLSYCLAIKEEVFLMLEKWWKYNYPPDSETKRWLEFFHSPNEVHKKFESYGKLRQHVSHDKMRKRKEIEEMKIETKFAENRYNDKIDFMYSKFEKIIKKYECSLLTNFIQFTTNPLVLRNFREAIKTIRPDPVKE